MTSAAGILHRFCDLIRQNLTRPGYWAEAQLRGLGGLSMQASWRKLTTAALRRALCPLVASQGGAEFKHIGAVSWCGEDSFVRGGLAVQHAVRRQGHLRLAGYAGPRGRESPAPGLLYDASCEHRSGRRYAYASVDRG